MRKLSSYLDHYPLCALLLIVIIGMAVRLYLLPTSGFSPDLMQHYDWAFCGIERGLFRVYECETLVTHPPISPTLLTAFMWLTQALGADVSYFTDNPAAVIPLKLPNLLFETAIIVLFFRVALEHRGARWAALAAAALYWNPGWLVVTAWWGQNDATFSVFLLLAAYCLTRDRPRLMWLAYGAAWLGKFQSIIFFPTLLILSLRRFGLRPTIEGGIMGALLFSAGVLPFIIGSGEMALTPYFGTVNLFPYIVNAGYNLWFVISGSSPIALVDSTPLIGSITYQQAGLIALSVGMLLILAHIWFIHQRRNDYLVLFAANFTFFMLATQVGMRYLYPGMMFLALAMMGKPRLIMLYGFMALAFTYTILNTVWLGVGLLYYPFQLMFWDETTMAVATIIVYIVFMAGFLLPLFRSFNSLLFNAQSPQHDAS